MANSKQPKPQADKPQKGELSEASLKKVTGGDMPTAVERRGSRS